MDEVREGELGSAYKGQREKRISVWTRFNILAALTSSRRKRVIIGAQAQKQK